MYVGTVGKSVNDTGLYQSFKLSDFPTSDVVSLYSDYKILKFIVTYRLVSQPNNNSNFPTLYIAPQHVASGTAPTSRDEVVQFKGVTSYQFGPSTMSYTRVFKPHMWLDSTGVTLRAVIPGTWCSTTSDTVPNFSHVYWLSRYNSAIDNSHTIELEVKAVIATRGTR